MQLARENANADISHVYNDNILATSLQPGISFCRRLQVLYCTIVLVLTAHTCLACICQNLHAFQACHHAVA